MPFKLVTSAIIFSYIGPMGYTSMASWPMRLGPLLRPLTQYSIEFNTLNLRNRLNYHM